MFSILVGAALKGTLVLATARLVTLAMRRCSAASRHLVWSGALAALLILPLLSLALPHWNLPASLDVGLTFHSSAVAPAASPDAPRSAGAAIPASSSAAAPFHPRSVDWPLLLLFLWTAGVLVALAQMALAYSALARRRRAARSFPDDTVPCDLARSLGIAHPVDVLQADAEIMPMTFGIFRPAVLMPASSPDWETERRRLVLLHELAHVRRGDPASHLMARFALALYWWNPLAWSAWREFLKERERAADDLVLNAGARPSDYAGHLLEVARSLRAPSVLSGAAIAMARRSQLEGRLLAILDGHRNRHAPRRASAVAAALAAVALLAPLAAVQAQDNPPLPGIDASIRAANLQKNHEILDRAAAAYRAARQFDAAETLLKSSAALRAAVSGAGSVDYAVGMVKLGDLERQRNHVKDATAFYSKAVALLGDRPEAAGALLYLGINTLASVPQPQNYFGKVVQTLALPLEQDKFGQAASYFQRAERSDPSLAGTATMWMAILRQRQQNTTEAEELFRSALAVQSGDPAPSAVTHTVYANFLRSQGRTDEAKAQDDAAATDRTLAAQKPTTAAGIYRAGGGVAAPRLLSKVEPSYSEEARAAKYQGTVIVCVVIGADGAAHDMQVVRGLGMGLDDQAMNAVSQWRFTPGTKNGVPVPVAATIEVNFRLL